MKTKTTKHISTHDLVYIAISIALITICSYITIPTTIPFTLQIFAVYFTLYFLGGKCGCIAVMIYLLLGIAGVPVFNGFKGGIGAIMSANGGFILSFGCTSILFFIISFIRDKKIVIVITTIITLIISYVFGTGWFIFITGATLKTAVIACVAPFVVFDVLKIIFAYFLSKNLRKKIK